MKKMMTLVLLALSLSVNASDPAVVHEATVVVDIKPVKEYLRPEWLSFKDDLPDAYPIRVLCNKHGEWKVRVVPAHKLWYQALTLPGLVDLNNRIQLAAQWECKVKLTANGEGEYAL